MDYMEQFEKENGIKATGEAMEWTGSSNVATLIYTEWLEKKLADRDRKMKKILDIIELEKK
jgi:hypothetical protein